MTTRPRRTGACAARDAGGRPPATARTTRNTKGKPRVEAASSGPMTDGVSRAGAVSTEPSRPGQSIQTGRPGRRDAARANGRATDCPDTQGRPKESSCTPSPTPPDAVQTAAPLRRGQILEPAGLVGGQTLLPAAPLRYISTPWPATPPGHGRGHPQGLPAAARRGASRLMRTLISSIPTGEVADRPIKADDFFLSPHQVNYCQTRLGGVAITCRN